MRLRGSLFLCVGIFLVVAVSLLPWWRNRAYLRDTFDYGVLMAAAGRVEAGQRPFVDFVSPLQTMPYLANWAAEKAFGHTYQGMTGGGAVVIVISVVVFALIFSRRWPVGVALLLSAVLTAAMASQHLIAFYNVLGGMGVIVAAWAAAVAPQWRREDWGWHLALGLALWIGGMNKLNWHLLALAVAVAWTLRAMIARRGSVYAGVAMLVFILLTGVIAPVATELAWTGASLHAWFYNVVEIPLQGSRSGDLASILTPKFYLEPHHNYYGALLVPQLALVGVFATVGVVGLACRRAWRRREWADVVFAPLAGLLAIAGGAGLLATNFDIAVVAVGAWFGLLAALWLGFELPTGGWAPRFGLLVAGLLGVVAWPAAWQGMRSQFGHLPGPRSAYVPAEEAGADYAYLRGTRLPPQMQASMHELAIWRQTNPAGAQRLFYGQGLEWLERCWPPLRVPERPLWMHFGTSYVGRTAADFLSALQRGAPHDRLVIPVSYDFWPAEVQAELAQDYVRSQLGPHFVLYERVPTDGVTAQPVDFLRQHGGNLDARFLASAMTSHLLPDGRSFLGVARGTGVMTMLAPARRVQAEAVLCRSTAERSQRVSATFVVLLRPPGGAPQECWRGELELAPGEEFRTVECSAAGDGVPFEFRVTLPDSAPANVLAGWRNPSIQHAIAQALRSPPLHPTKRDPVPLDVSARLALFGGTKIPDAAVVHGGEVRGTDFVLLPGGEVWLHVPDGGVIFNGSARLAEPPAAGHAPSAIYTAFYKGARLDMQSSVGLRAADGQAEFRVWSAEPDGWLVIGMENGGASSPLVIRIARVP